MFSADSTPPVIEQLNDIIITITSGQANIAQVTWQEPSVSDNSGTATLVSRTRAPNSFFQVGTTPVTYTYTDPSGNTASMTFNVIVNVVGGKQLGVLVKYEFDYILLLYGVATALQCILMDNLL